MGNNQGYWTHEPILKYLAVHNRKIVHLNQPDYLSNKALTNFAYGIEKDWEAVQAAIDIPFSNGLLEGTVNKIKAVKRQMYNRAGSKLLRAKILYSQ